MCSQKNWPLCKWKNINSTRNFKTLKNNWKNVKRRIQTWRHKNENLKIKNVELQSITAHEAEDPSKYLEKTLLELDLKKDVVKKM